MLSRADSDFDWFRERALSLQSDPLSSYNKMASSSSSGPLNPEPSQPQDRAALDLSPKSYADAVIDPPTQNGDGAGALSNGVSQHSPAMVNGLKTSLDAERVKYEKHVGRDGESSLTSIKPDEDYESSLRHNAKTAPRARKPVQPSNRQNIPNANLASGRKAGAGWERSAYGPMDYSASLTGAD